MNDKHITEQLHAYHDGELQGRALRLVETHLADCADCRARLEQLDALHGLLFSDVLPAGLADDPRFSAEVNLRLQRREQVASSPERVWRVGWYLLPVGLLGLWVVWQAARLTASAVALALSLDWLPSFASPSASVLQVLLVNVVLPALLMLAWAGWLASWWTSRSARNGSSERH